MEDALDAGRVEEDTDGAHAAAALFDRVLKRRGDRGSAAEMRTIGYFLNMAYTSIVDTELESRLTALEE